MIEYNILCSKVLNFLLYIFEGKFVFKKEIKLVSKFVVNFMEIMLWR